MDSAPTGYILVHISRSIQTLWFTFKITSSNSKAPSLTGQTEIHALQ